MADRLGSATPAVDGTGGEGAPLEALEDAVRRVRAGDVAGARAILVAARRRWSSNRVLLHRLLQLLHHDLPAALEEYERIRASPGPDLTVFLELLYVCRSAGDLPQALALWRDLLDCGLLPAVEHWQALLAVAAGAGVPTAGLPPEPDLEAWAKLHEAALGEPPPRPAPRPAAAAPMPVSRTSRRWRDLTVRQIRHHLALRERREALALCGELVDAGWTPPGSIWEALAFASAAAGEGRALASLVLHAQGRSGEPPRVAWTSLHDGLARAGQRRLAVALIELACQRGARPGRGCLVHFIDACATAVPPECSAALRLTRRVRALGYSLNASLCDQLMRVLAVTGRTEEALGLLDELRAAGRRPRSRTLGRAVHCLLRLGRHGEATRLFGEYCARRVPPAGVYAQLLERLRHAGDLANAVCARTLYEAALTAHGSAPVDDEDEDDEKDQDAGLASDKEAD